MSDADVVVALTALRDAGLVVDRDELNRAWSELTGRAVAAPPRDHPTVVTVETVLTVET